MKALPRGLRTVLWVQFGIALLFLFFGYSETRTTRLGRAPSLADMIALSAPLLLVIVASLIAGSFARKGDMDVARLIAWSPLPLAILLSMLSGIV
jgi:hypothetical protein